MKNIINLLKNKKNLDEYRIISIHEHSTELFFIKEELQMNRAKDVDKINLTVYKNFEIDNNKFKGSSTVRINPTDSLDEIDQKINKAALAASFVKNAYYPLPQKSEKIAPEIKSKFSESDVVELLSEIVNEAYGQNNQFGAFVNSCEFFITTRENRIINSSGIDVTYNSYNGLIEIITEAKGDTEEIELFDMIHFSDFDREFIKTSIRDQLKYASLRAKAIKTPKLDNIPVIINGKAINEFWDYYINQASADSKYNHLHENSVGDNIQGDEIIGDKVTIKATPQIPNSIDNTYYDADGFLLEEKTIIENGILKNMLANTRYAHYFNLKPTGNLRNLIVSGGNQTENDLRETPYLEVISFSAFQMDPMTGFFGGEFRLAIYHDGNKEIPLTQGAVSTNIKEAQKEMYFSKETVQSRNVITPKIVKFNKMTIVGGN
ncbi:metallopeptidase TldD-related protein [Candidatus Izemoplasma sp. B36]|uniref:metallopeptidase TldD-related protein n=1 Tax=Candidatus Izemoplasma sp. B36 TaxID=3242468 RepID=UPI0035589E51